MDGLILEPLKYYKTDAKARHRDNINERFDELVRESGIDVEANRQTVKRYDAEMEKVKKVSKKLGWYTFLYVFLIIIGIVGICILLFGLIDPTAVSGGVMIGALSASAVGFILAFTVVRKKKKNIEAQKQKLLDAANKIKAEALAQMAPLNSLFSGLDTLRLIEKTTPEIKFDTGFSWERERELIERFDYIDLTDEETTVTGVLSGRIFDNPFLFERYVSHSMGTQTYTGTKTIHWTETYRDSEGRVRTRTRTQVLTATVIKPKPYYTEHTHLGFGSQAAPDLSFTRRESDTDELSERALEKRIKAGEKKLQKQAAKAMREGRDFQEMANSEFEVLFGAKNRNHEVQFRLMFTPLAQNNTVDLLREKDGYGDDFNFIKQGRFNIIKSKHGQSWEMDLSPTRYRSHSVDLSREAYLSFNENYYKSVFFDLAPLIAIPAYHEGPVASMDSLNRNYPSCYTAYEHEILANAIGDGHFAHERSATRAILKTDILEHSCGVDRVRVNAYSYCTEPRLDFVPTLGGDGRIHAVPVPWLEYIPVKRSTDMVVSSVAATEREINADGGIPYSALRDGLLAYAPGEKITIAESMNIFKRYTKN